MNKITSIRFWLACGAVALVPTWLMLKISDSLGWTFYVFLAAIVMFALGHGAALHCPHCRKNVKVGASTCHHCGKEVPE